LVFVLTALCASAQTGSGPEIKVHPVRGGIYMLEGNGGNVGVSIGDDGLLIVDDQYAPMAPKIRAALRELLDEPVTFLLNTHHHIDHTGGNATFAEEAHIVAHQNVRTRLGRSSVVAAHTLPVITFDDSLSIHWNGEEIRMVHFPHGHTDNDSVVFFIGSNVVHMGDLLFTGSFPSFYPSEGGDIRGYRDNVGKILTLLPEDALMIPGHGALATRDDVEAFHQMLEETIAIIEQRIAKGVTEEGARAEGLPEHFQRWASRFTSVEQWVSKVYLDLAANQ
jgi:glyoxylase-like metal-dependent hydrolase (beta-lactamase superfamily II)